MNTNINNSQTLNNKKPNTPPLNKRQQEEKDLENRKKKFKILILLIITIIIIIIVALLTTWSCSTIAAGKDASKLKGHFGYQYQRYFKGSEEREYPSKDHETEAQINLTDFHARKLSDMVVKNERNAVRIIFLPQEGAKSSEIYNEETGELFLNVNNFQLWNNSGYNSGLTMEFKANYNFSPDVTKNAADDSVEVDLEPNRIDTEWSFAMEQALDKHDCYLHYLSANKRIDFKIDLRPSDGKLDFYDKNDVTKQKYYFNFSTDAMKNGDKLDYITKNPNPQVFDSFTIAHGKYNNKNLKNQKIIIKPNMSNFSNEVYKKMILKIGFDDNTIDKGDNTWFEVVFDVDNNGTIATQSLARYTQKLLSADPDTDSKIKVLEALEFTHVNTHDDHQWEISFGNNDAKLKELAKNVSVDVPLTFAIFLKSRNDQLVDLMANEGAQYYPKINIKPVIYNSEITQVFGTRKANEEQSEDLKEFFNDVKDAKDAKDVNGYDYNDPTDIINTKFFSSEIANSRNFLVYKQTFVNLTENNFAPKIEYLSNDHSNLLTTIKVKKANNSETYYYIFRAGDFDKPNIRPGNNLILNISSAINNAELINFEYENADNFYKKKIIYTANTEVFLGLRDKEKLKNNGDFILDYTNNSSLTKSQLHIFDQPKLSLESSDTGKTITTFDEEPNFFSDYFSLNITKKFDTGFASYTFSRIWTNKLDNKFAEHFYPPGSAIPPANADGVPLDIKFCIEVFDNAGTKYNASCFVRLYLEQSLTAEIDDLSSNPDSTNWYVNDHNIITGKGNLVLTLKGSSFSRDLDNNPIISTIKPISGPWDGGNLEDLLAVDIKPAIGSESGDGYRDRIYSAIISYTGDKEDDFTFEITFGFTNDADPTQPDTTWQYSNRLIVHYKFAKTIAISTEPGVNDDAVLSLDGEKNRFKATVTFGNMPFEDIDFENIKYFIVDKNEYDLDNDKIDDIKFSIPEWIQISKINELKHTNITLSAIEDPLLLIGKDGEDGDEFAKYWDKNRDHKYTIRVEYTYNGTEKLSSLLTQSTFKIAAPEHKIKYSVDNNVIASESIAYKFVGGTNEEISKAENSFKLSGTDTVTNQEILIDDKEMFFYAKISSGSEGKWTQMLADKQISPDPEKNYFIDENGNTYFKLNAQKYHNNDAGYANILEYKDATSNWKLSVHNFKIPEPAEIYVSNGKEGTKEKIGATLIPSENVLFSSILGNEGDTNFDKKNKKLTIDLTNEETNLWIEDSLNINKAIEKITSVLNNLSQKGNILNDDTAGSVNYTFVENNIEYIGLEHASDGDSRYSNGLLNFKIKNDSENPYFKCTDSTNPSTTTYPQINFDITISVNFFTTVTDIYDIYAKVGEIIYSDKNKSDDKYNALRSLIKRKVIGTTTDGGKIYEYYLSLGNVFLPTGHQVATADIALAFNNAIEELIDSVDADDVQIRNFLNSIYYPELTLNNQTNTLLAEQKVVNAHHGKIAIYWNEVFVKN